MGDSNDDRKYFKKNVRRKPYFPRPEKQSLNVVTTDEKKPDEYSPFSRYPIKIPKVKKNKHFSLPIDSFATTNIADPVKLSPTNSVSSEEEFVSFDEQLMKMLQHLEMKQNKEKQKHLLENLSDESFMVNIWKNNSGDIEINDKKLV